MRIFLAIVALGVFVLVGIRVWPSYWARHAPPATAEQIRKSEQAILAAITLETDFRKLALQGGQKTNWEKAWQAKAPKDPWGQPLHIHILRLSPFSYSVCTMTPWPEVKVIEYDSRFPEKGVYSYHF